MDIVLIGASGFGSRYINYFCSSPEGVRLKAVIDPFVDLSANKGWIEENNILVLNSLDEFYGLGHKADLVIISSPTHFHKEQGITAMKNGSAVLCEKPLCSVPKDAFDLKKTQEETGMVFGVGFQWSYSKAMQDLKRDVLNGKFGNPILLKSTLSPKRNNTYYDPRGWKGKRHDSSGNIVMDSILINGTSHYFHNMLFILGEEMDKAKCPDTVSAALYRGREIETFDTCFIEAEFSQGYAVQFSASHVAEREVFPKLEYQFEKGTVFLDKNKSNIMYAEFNDGTVKEYGDPDEDRDGKIDQMIFAAKNKCRPACGIDTVIPHLLVSDALVNSIEATEFPFLTKGSADVTVKGLNEAMEYFYINGVLPQEYMQEAYGGGMKAVSNFNFSN